MSKLNTQRGIVSVRAEADDNPVKLMQDFTAQFSAFKEANTKALEEVKSTVTEGDKISAEAVAKAEAAAAEVQKIAANLKEIEQKVADRVQSGKGMPAGTIGQILVASKEYKSAIGDHGQGFTPGAGFKLRVEANTITGQEGSPPENSDVLVPKDRRSGIIPGATRALRIADVLNVIPTSSNAYEFTRELAWTNNAAETAEGAAKPQSSITFENQTVNVRTIAHYLKASVQILSDAPALRSYADGRLRYGVEYRLDSQLAKGNGTGQNISGMTASGNHTAFTPTSGENALDSLNRGKYQLIAADYSPTGILINPASWGEIERLKTATGEASYVVGNPFGSIVPMLWGIPVVVSNAITAGTFIMADFQIAYDLIMRQSTVIDLGYENDDFTKNLVTLRAENRACLATPVPAASIYGYLSA